VSAGVTLAASVMVVAGTQPRSVSVLSRKVSAKRRGFGRSQATPVSITQGRRSLTGMIKARPLSALGSIGERIIACSLSGNPSLIERQSVAH
jgi:hypothetical protein